MTSPWSTSPAPCPSQVSLGAKPWPGDSRGRDRGGARGLRAHGVKGNALEKAQLCPSHWSDWCSPFGKFWRFLEKGNSQRLCPKK